MNQQESRSNTEIASANYEKAMSLIERYIDMEVPVIKNTGYDQLFCLAESHSDSNDLINVKLTQLKNGDVIENILITKEGAFSEPEGMDPMAPLRDENYTIEERAGMVERLLNQAEGYFETRGE